MSGNLDRVRELFEVARELTPEDRKLYLDEACAGNRELREEIESLLAAEEGIDSFLDGSDLGQALNAAVSDNDNALVGKMVGRYRVLETIARGGMGVVYLAEQTNPDRQVALKLMAPSLLTPEVARRFEVEVQVMGRLQHPGIAQIFEAGTTEIGHAVWPFFAMEYIDGLPVTRWAEERALDLRSRLVLMIKICEGVGHAHRKGVIHRDLKPANILVDRSGQPKVLDFGVARGTDADLQATTLGAGSSGLLGTLAYMSPEQVRGDTAELDTRSDVYSLGVVCCELLSGRPFHDLKGKTITDAIRTVSGGGSAAAAAAVRSLPDDLATIVRKALAAEPDQRYDSVSALADDMRRFLDNRPILARPPSTWYNLRKLVSRHRIASLLAGMMLVLLVVGGVVVVDQNRRIRAERDKATREAATAEQVSEFLEDLFSGPDPRVARGQELTARQMLDRGAGRIESDLAGQPLVQARLMVLMGTVYKNLGLPEEAGSLLERGVEIGRTVMEEDPVSAVRGMQVQAWLHRNAGEFEDGIAVARDAIRLSEAARGPDHSDTADLLITLGVMLRDGGKLEEAQSHLNRAVELSEELYGPRSLQVAGALNHLAWLEFRLGNNQESLEAYQRACPILEEVTGPDDTTLAWCLNDHSTVLAHLRRNEEAGELLNRAIGIWEKVLPDRHPHLALAASNLANLYYAKQDYEQALLQYGRGLEIRRHALPPDHPDVGHSLCSVAYAERKLGRWTEAEQHFLEGISVIEASQGPDDTQVINNLLGLADLYMEIGRYGEAAGIHERIVDSRTRTMGADHLWVAGALNKQGQAMMVMKRYGEAESLLRRAAELANALAEPDSPGGAAISNRLALCLLRMGRFQEAEAFLEGTRAVFEKKESGGEVVLSEVHFYLSRLGRMQGDDTGADRHLDQAIALRRSVRPADDGQLLYLQAVRTVRQDPVAARDLLNRALDHGFPSYSVDQTELDELR